jgi:hypothetical protein
MTWVLLALGFLVAAACSGIPSSSGLTTGQTVDGVCRGVDGTTGNIFIEVNGVQKEYPRAPDCKFYDADGNPVTSQMGAAFRDVKVTAKIEKKDGKEYVKELRGKRL